MENKSCQYCKNYVRHYYKGKTRFYGFEFGHCKRNRKTQAISFVCKNYSEIDQKTIEGKNASIIYLLSDILKSIKLLTEIYLAIEKDND